MIFSKLQAKLIQFVLSKQPFGGSLPFANSIKLNASVLITFPVFCLMDNKTFLNQGNYKFYITWIFFTNNLTWIILKRLIKQPSLFLAYSFSPLTESK